MLFGLFSFILLLLIEYKKLGNLLLFQGEYFILLFSPFSRLSKYVTVSILFTFWGALECLKDVSSIQTSAQAYHLFYYFIVRFSAICCVRIFVVAAKLPLHIQLIPLSTTGILSQPAEWEAKHTSAALLQCFKMIIHFSRFKNFHTKKQLSTGNKQFSNIRLSTINLSPAVTTL